MKYLLYTVYFVMILLTFGCSETEQPIVVLAHANISSRLLSPENAKFSDEYVSKDGHTVCGWVSGVNPFGVRLPPVRYSYYYGGEGHEYVDLATDSVEYEYAIKHCAEAGL